MRTHYDLLGIEPAADAEQVKRAFRREIARYHPDKVQHLGSEFQEIAAARAAALTEAYRVLMDAELRQRYDESLLDEPLAPPVARPRASSPSPAPQQSPAAEYAPATGPDRRISDAQASTSGFVRRAVTARLKDGVAALGGSIVNVPGFDAVFHIKGRKPLFRQPEPTVRLAVRIVPAVNAATVEEAWAAALRLAAADETLCLMLLGSGVAPARELSLVVSELRKKTRKGGPIVIPVDVRDWEALFPPETPTAVRVLLERLRQGD